MSTERIGTAELCALLAVFHGTDAVDRCSISITVRSELGGWVFWRIDEHTDERWRCRRATTGEWYDFKSYEQFMDLAQRLWPEPVKRPWTDHLEAEYQRFREKLGLRDDD